MCAFAVTAKAERLRACCACVLPSGKEASTIVIKGAGSSSNSSSDSSNSTSSNSTSSNSTAAVYIGCVWSEGRADADYTLVAGFAQAAIHLQAGVPQVTVVSCTILHVMLSV
jgi:bacillopeptidase F (M6 metalloprotease family)